MFKFLKNWALVLAICLGCALHDVAGRLMFATPYLLFTMLLLTFANVSPRDLRFERLHLILMGVQLAATLGLYAVLLPIEPRYAQAAAISAFMPTAAAAAVLTGMLGGSIAFTAAYICLCSVVMALAAPVLMPLIASNHGSESFVAAMLDVARQIFPVVLLPLAIDWALQLCSPKAHLAILSRQAASFWLWALLLVILMGNTFHFILTAGADVRMEISMAVIGVAVCVAQFVVGKTVGGRFGRRISGGQSLAQKNASFGMWLCLHYFDPVVSISCAAYSLAQNLINSCQIWLFQRKTDDAKRLRER